MSKRAETAAVVLGFAVLAVAATWPLARVVANHLPSDLGDPLLTAWTLGWDADRMRRGLAGLWDAPSYFPYRHTLLYSDHLLGIAVFTAPLQWLTRNPVLAYNAAFLASFVLAGGGMYVLARELTGRRDAAFVAGVIFATQPFRASHYSHLQWLVTGWLPLCLWTLHRYFSTGRPRWLLGAAACYLLQALTASYFTYYALVPMLTVAAVEWRRARRPIGRVLRDAVVPAVLVLAVLLPVVRGYSDLRSASGLRRSSQDVVDYSADVGDYLSASPQLRLWGGLGSGRGEHELFPGFAALLLGAVGIAAGANRRAVLLYAGVLAVAFLLSLGPAPTAWGHALGVPGPYAALLRVVPGLDGLRAPARLAVGVQVALAVLAAFGTAWLFDRVPARRRSFGVAVLAGVVAAEGWAAPLRVAAFEPRGDSSERAAYEYLRSLPSGAVMELPTSVDFVDPEFRYQYMTLVHQKRVVNGHSGYVTPLIQWLGGGHSPFREIDRQSDAVDMLRGFGVRYLVIHKGLYTDTGLADALLAVVEREPAQVIAHRSFGDITVAVLAPYTLPAVPPGLSEIAASSIRATASRQDDRLAALFDGDVDSRWLSGVPQRGDEWVQLDLGAPRDVRVLRLRTGVRSFGDYPRDLSVESIEGETTRTLFRGSPLPHFVRGLLADPDYPWIDIVLPENHARTLRLRQLGTSRTFFWSIHELRLLERI